MKRMNARDYNEMLNFAPQREDESRFARDYREQRVERSRIRRRKAAAAAVELAQAVFLLAAAYMIWFVAAVVL